MAEKGSDFIVRLTGNFRLSVPKDVVELLDLHEVDIVSITVIRTKRAGKTKSYSL